VEVEDAASPTGYKLDIRPFPGWEDVRPDDLPADNLLQ
jgi:hypothetical protein